MKRNIKNEKVLRAISIGLATMIAVTSTPITVFAEEEGTQQTAESGSEQSEGDGQTSENEASEPSEEVTVEKIESIESDITSKDEAGEDPGVSQSIDKAQEEVAKTKIPALIDAGGEGTTALEDLKAAKNAVDDNINETGEIAKPEDKETMDYLQDLVEDLKEGIKTNNAAQEQAKKDAEAINNSLDNLVVAELEPVVGEDGNPVVSFDGYDTDGNAVYTPQMQVVYKNAFGEAVNKIEGNLKDSADNVKTANGSDSEEVAKAAAKAANDNLKNMSDGLEEADKALDAAKKGAEKASEDLQKKQKEFEEATVELAKLQKSLDGAKTESKNSHDAVLKAQEKVNALKVERDEAFKESDEAELTLIAAVYEKFNTVDVDQKDKSKKYHDKLNVLISENKIDQYNAWKSNKSVVGLNEEDRKQFEEVKRLYTEASNAYTQAWVEAGNLSKALIKYYISHEDGYVDGSFKISGGIDGEGYENIAKDLLGYSRKIGDKTYYFPDKNAEEGDPNKGFSFRTDTGWVTSPKVDNVDQPNNVVVVRYQTKVAEVDENGNPKIKDGSPVYQTKDVERYYNVKRDKGFCFFERTIEVIDGKLVFSTDDPKEEDVKDASVVESFNIYRNAVSKLNDELKAAKEAVGVAEEKTRKLMEDIAKLKVSAPESKELGELAARLEQYKSLLKDAQDHRDELQKLYEEAKDSVEKIDLSRFAIPVVVDDDDDDDYDESGSSADAVAGSGTVIGTVASMGTLPSATVGAGSPVGGTGAGAGTGVTAGGRGAGVLGARNPEANASGNNVAVNSQGKDVKNAGKDKTVVADANGNGNDVANGTKVANPETPLNATPFSEESTGFNWLWLVGAAAAAAAGAGAFGYGNHRKKVAANEEAKKYKK